MKTVLRQIVEEISKNGTNDKFNKETAEWLEKERKQMLEFGMLCLTSMEAYRVTNTPIDQAIEDIFKTHYESN